MCVCVGGGGGGRWFFRWRGYLLKLIGVGWDSDTWKKTINVRIVNTQICQRICTG